MYSTIRRQDRAISREESNTLLHTAEYGFLATVGSDGQPYGIPLSYVYWNERIYFHCALEGAKLNNIAKNPLVSFCVVGSTEVIPRQFSTKYESVVLFGTAREATGEERHHALLALLSKYSPDFHEEGKAYISQKDHLTRVIAIDIQHITGKARK
ncbi:pyridoxamine 5'-phosphate oxidase family protein [Chrysiogenes arsenatis]|uniref:pyridoxamine 5'-phosphate oxidase family protein n=1 Tax=Chrysiogenes arsenatis TaxID=309797 RepID=UPI00048553D2|nr:pyridoxamine 5'-phosphate oxidase family protein [Chrysiogenes arsenatis]